MTYRPSSTCSGRLAASAAALLLAGCASSVTPHYDARFGDAVRQARAAQTINPNAGSQPMVVGMDGKAAQEANVRYLESFKRPPPTVSVINIGGGLAGGGGGAGR